MFIQYWIWYVSGGMVNGHGGGGHGGHGDDGVTDMVTISNIDEHVINNNLKKRYLVNKIYVSLSSNKDFSQGIIKNPLYR